MLTTDDDKETERRRYERSAQQVLGADHALPFAADGAAAIAEEVRAPYLAYEDAQKRFLRPGMKVLEVCGGTGLHSLTPARCGADVTVTDISAAALGVARLRAEAAGLRVHTVVADAESIPFPDGSFSAILCAGGMSYMDHAKFFRELRRLMRPDGRFVAVDSFNHNPLYRFNRWIRYLRGHRTRSTLRRMPDEALLAQLGTMFGKVEVQYFGVLSFMVPVIKPFLGPAGTARWLERTDARLTRQRRHAFKVVVDASRPKVHGAISP
ncbi:MAG: class I SAM-dependent methyltransferase [Verrucomicrobia bacterium]|nr:class I SAM-dependent methyltransferase [Verrucomicrobiota bacterium]